MFVQANCLLYMAYKFKRLAGKLKLHHEQEYGQAKKRTIRPTTAKGSISMQRTANQRSMMPETRGKLNQYLLATSETEEKDYGISARRRRQSLEPAKEQPRQSLRRIQHTSLRFKFTHVLYMFFQTQIVNLYPLTTTQTRKFTSLRKPYMYICRNKLVYNIQSRILGESIFPC